MGKAFISILLFLISTSLSFSDQTEIDYYNDQDVINDNQSAVVDAANAFDPDETFDDYDPNPSQTSYYHGVDQYSSELESEGNSHLSEDKAGSTVYLNFASRDRITINPESPTYQDSIMIQEHSYNITHGISDDKIDCESGKSCRIAYEPASCQISNSFDTTCTSEPIVETVKIEAPNCTHYLITGENIQTIAGANSQGFCQTGIKSWKLKGYDTSLNRTSPSSLITPANYEHVRVVVFASLLKQFSNTSAGVHETVSSVGTIYLPTMYSPGYYENSIEIAPSDTVDTYSVSVSAWFATGVGINTLIYGTFVEYPLDQSENRVTGWKSSCPWPDGSQPANCSINGEPYCTSGAETRNINGKPIYQDCWQETQNYTCHASIDINNCQSYQNTCDMTHSNCVEDLLGQCVRSEYQYSCPTRVCDGNSIACANNVFCIDGDCAEQNPEFNENFGQDISEVAAVSGAIDDLNANSQVNFFNGHSQECSIDIANYQDCCVDDGWGSDLGLANCSDEEKKLSEDKKNYLVSYVGKYCHTQVLGVCTAEHEVYCVWDSKMARITEDYGRSQVSRGYGSAEHPDCSGFTMDEFELLDFDQINYIDPIYIYPNGSPNEASGLAGDMSVDSPSSEEMQDAINEQIQEDLNNNSPSTPTDNPNTEAMALSIQNQLKVKK
ncbi:conjugal transfer protein TraN [Thiotrichales bacterium 19S11-10]|nr:conjugal transfer protein TraN [Thiotrichales bacterium 19S11-10]